MSTKPIPTTESLRDAYEAQCDQIARLREQLAAAQEEALGMQGMRDQARAYATDWERRARECALSQLEAEATAERLAGALRFALDHAEPNNCTICDEYPPDEMCPGHRALATFKSGTALAEHDKALTESLRARIAMLKDAIDRDRTGLAAALSRIIKEIRSRSWILEGRGAYEWDDDRYKEEAGLAMREAKNIADDALNASGKLAQQAYTATDAEVSAWLAEHDARVRKEALEEAAQLLDRGPGFGLRVANHDRLLAEMAAAVRALTKEQPR
jgi:hypothetical protein